MKKSAIVIFLIFIMLSLCSCSAKNNAQTDSAKLLELCNQERASAGLPELTINDGLSKNAQTRAYEIAESGNFSHIRPDGSGCFTAVTVDYSFAGENLASGDGDVQDVFKEWMASPDHKANIMNSSYTQTGFGCSEKNGVVYRVQLFIG